MNDKEIRAVEKVFKADNDGNDLSEKLHVDVPKIDVFALF